MARLRHIVRFVAAALAAALLSAAPAAAQNLQNGDIVVPGNRVVDGFGSVNGCFYRLREGVVTRLFQSALFRSPKDMIVDSQGRLVFFASAVGRNNNDNALFRIDPANGELERLYYFPYIVQAGDTLPDGASMITQFPYGSHNQSLHREQSFDVTIDDDANGGWPQVQTGEKLGFAMTAFAATGEPPMTFRYDPADRSCEVGIPTPLLPVSGAPCMASDDAYIYYGLSKTIGRTGVPTHVDLHLDGDWGQLDISATVPPKDILIISGNAPGAVFDNTRDPNGTVQCGPTVDTDVPFNSSGSTFAALSMDGLGLLSGSLYVSANSAGTGTPFAFRLAPRDPYLNPYTCLWYPAAQGTGPLGFALPNGTPTSASHTSPDGDGLLGVGNGVLKRTDPEGGFEVLDSSEPYTGRPWRWNGPTALARSPGAASDSGAQLLVVRADTLVNVQLTDEQGRRIGHDAAGNPVNDFGESGQVLALGAGGWPRVIVLRDPTNGTYSAEVGVTGAGDWSVKSYLAHQGGGGNVAMATGSAAGASTVIRGLYVGQPTGLTWYASPLAVGDPNATVGAGFVSVWPVPTCGEVRLAYRVPGNGANVRLEIFDVAGRLVATPIREFQPSGTHVLTWRGEGVSGARLAHGIYLASLNVNGLRETRRVVLTN